MSQESPTGYQGVKGDTSLGSRRFIAEVKLSTVQRRRLLVSGSFIALGPFDTAVEGAVSYARFRRLVSATTCLPAE